ncbi:hypothetical protein B9Z55_026006 [Caenorhabditis nigoni]|uniref:Uncharacterized protein n=1 Tax=Caenorhabditis nigoni TaxID=1611254 RepID=A0A2G5T0U9_9PELO|nr:hypothetical protein B9Z55_026006 [Caenorhabditis nigoni]
MGRITDNADYSSVNFHQHSEMEHMGNYQYGDFETHAMSDNSYYSTPDFSGLKDAKCVVKLNDERKMTYFSSPDGTVFESQQSLDQKRCFQIKPENYKKKTGVKPARRSSQNVRNPSPASMSPIIPNPPEVNDVEMEKRRGGRSSRTDTNK